MEELKRKLASPVMRDWLRAEDELRITSTTTHEEIENFTKTVGAGQDTEKLKEAIRAIVAQAKEEIKKKSGRALLVCKTYYLKWRGEAWKEKGASEKKKAEKGRYGLFLVRGCQRCRVVTKDGNKQPATAAVFRIPAYHPTPRAASVRKPTQPKVKGNGEVPSVPERPKKCRCEKHDTAEPWKCKCCKHLYCPGHHGEGARNVKRATCSKCKRAKWMRRSQSTGTFKNRTALTSCYESLRAGVFFVDEGLTEDMAKYLLDKYERGSVESQDSRGAAETGQELKARAESIAEPREADSAETVAASLGAVAKSQGALASNEASGPEAERVPKITLGEPLRSSGRSRSKPERRSSFGRMV